MTSQTKVSILERHRANSLLNAPGPALTRHDAGDVSVDEMVAPLSEEIIAGAAGALEDGMTHYVAVPGIDPLREAVAGYLNRAAGNRTEKNNVLVTAGVQESRFLTLQLLDRSRVAIPVVVHPGVRQALGVRPRDYETLTVDPERALPTLTAIRAALKDGCDLLFLESPSRLTGAAYTADEVGEIAELVRANDAAVIWDQGFAPWVRGGAPSLMGVAGMDAHTVVIGEAFPGMGLSSWFVGYIAAPTDWIPPMEKQKQVMAICTSTASQYAALAAADIFQASHAGHIEKLAAARTSLTELASQAGLTIFNGEAVNVLALRMPAAHKASALRVWADAGYTVADGADFGVPDAVRLTVAVDGTTANALQLLVEQKG